MPNIYDTESDNYAADLSPREAWERLAEDPDAQLVDVRSDAEWAYVGAPDLTELGKEVIFVAWREFPGMGINREFSGQVKARLDILGLTASTPLLFICRSGQRSRSAAQAMTEGGYGQCYNVEHGFEGDPDRERHRGRINGWKVDGLPWGQG